MSVLVMAGGAIFLCLWRGPLRFAGIAVIALGTAFVPLKAEPDILVDATAANAAIRNQAGELVPADPRKTRFSVERWLSAEGDRATSASFKGRSGWTCDKGSCKAEIKGKVVVYLRDETGISQCLSADIVVAAFPLRGACRKAGLRVDRFDVWRQGAFAIYVGPQAISFVTARGEQGDRPWTVRPQARRTIVVADQGSVPSTHSTAGQDHASPAQP
jgi:competence protein ComEC